MNAVWMYVAGLVTGLIGGASLALLWGRVWYCRQCGTPWGTRRDKTFGIICGTCLKGFGPCSEDDLPI